MVTNHKELPKILELLKENPRGMSVTQIAEAIRMNRISVARYLDILLTSGQVDMVRYGQAKLYYISHRVPVSALLDFSSDYVAVLGKEQKIVQANTNLINLFNLAREDIIDKKLDDVLHPMTSDVGLQTFIDKALVGEEVSEEICIVKDDDELFFDMKIIPTAFADGSPGITIILEDITEQKRAMVALIESENRFRALVEHISELLVNVERYAHLNDQIRDPLQAIVGIAEFEGDGELTEKIYQQAKAIDEIITTLDIGRMEAENIRDFLRKHYGVSSQPEHAKRIAAPNIT
jgi:PAS domain S-box-containing protein